MVINDLNLFLRGYIKEEFSVVDYVSARIHINPLNSSQVMNNSSQVSHYKIKTPIRNQMEIQINCLDSLLPANHKARNVWEFVNTMDCSPCFALLNTFDGSDGRPATSPQVLLTLWIYSILDGNISARKLETLCKYHDAYKWIAGGLHINRTTLGNFRTLNPIFFEDLLTNCLAVMFKAGLINDTDFAQDGTRIKANAGFNSFHTENGLEKTKKEIKEYINNLKMARNDAYDKNKQKRQERIAQERLRKVEEALKLLEKEREIKNENGKSNYEPPSEDDLKKVRVSTTDHSVRKMKMGDGGFRLAYNVQLATGMASRVIFGVDVVTTLDPGTSSRMMAQVHSRLRKIAMETPKNWVGDCAYSGKKDVECAADLFPNCRYYAPPKVKKGIDPKKHLKSDSEAIKKWRDLIDKEEIKVLYSKRCSTAEFSNAQMKQRGWREFLVRGIEKVMSSALLNAIAQNITRYFDLKSQMYVTT